MDPKKRRNIEAMISGAVALAYLLLCALSQTAADIFVIPAALLSLGIFADVANARANDKEAVSYSLLWGTAALALFLGFVAYQTLRLYLGLK